LAELVVFRRLRSAPPVTSLVATVGLTVVLQGVAVKRYGSLVRTSSILSDGVVSIFGRPFPVDRLWMTLAACILAGGVVYVYRANRFGLATRAAFLNEKGAVLLGFDPRRLGLVNSLVAAGLSGVIGILASSLGGVGPFMTNAYVVPALAAALAARLQSVTVALAAGIGIGMFEALTVHLVARRQVPDVLSGGFSSLLPFAVIVITLILRGRTLPDRSLILEAARVPMPSPRLKIGWLLAIGPAVGIVAFGGSPVRFALAQTMFVTTLLLSVVVLAGFGIRSLMQRARLEDPPDGTEVVMLQLDADEPFTCAGRYAVCSQSNASSGVTRRSFVSSITARSNDNSFDGSTPMASGFAPTIFEHVRQAPDVPGPNHRPG
jgi:branched-chain amino acid transport system permease protein